MDDLYPHQRKALAKLKNGSILWGAVGTGKSKVAAAYYVKHESPKQVIVITTAKKRDSKDWEKEFSDYAVGKEASQFHGSLIVDSWNNLHKYVAVAGQFFIFDEQRLVGAGEWTKAFLKIAKFNNWILLSATPGDTWLDYIPVFVANGFYRNRTAFKREHVVYAPYTTYPKVERYLNVQKLVRYRNDILVKMPFQGETTRHSFNQWTEYDPADYIRVENARWNVFEERPITSLAELFHCLRRVANSHPSRVQEVEALLLKYKRLIVFYNFNYELDILRTLGGNKYKYPRPFVEWNGHQHDEIPDTDSWVYLVQYTAGAEGWNCTSTNAMCMYSLPYSYKAWEQAHGRIDRLDTPYHDLFYYYLRSKSAIDLAIWRALSHKKSFQNAQYGIKNSQF